MPEREVSTADMMPLLRERLDAGQQVRFTPEGVSMLPFLRPGRDSVTVAPLAAPPKKHDIVLYRRADGSYVLHRVVRPGEPCLCAGDNQTELEAVPTARMFAVVTAFCRNGRERRADAPGCLFYSRLWQAVRPLRRIWRGCRARIGRIIR